MKNNLTKKAENWANTTFKDTIKNIPTSNLKNSLNYWEKNYKVEKDNYSKKIISIYKKELQNRENKKNQSKKNSVRAGEIWSINDINTRGHKSIITKRKKNEPTKVEHIPITHAPKTRNKKNIKLEVNPEKGKKDDSYILSSVQKSNIKDLGKKHTNIKIDNPIDKSKIRHVKNKSK